MSRIDNFKGEYYYLSNFYNAPVIYDGIHYENNEAAFQAQKCPLYSRERYSNVPPNIAKRMGRREILPVHWEEEKDKHMYEIVKAKFTQNIELGKKLVETGDAYLEEGNTWNDTYWGVCNCEGLNKLGHILMRVREEIKPLF